MEYTHTFIITDRKKLADVIHLFGLPAETTEVKIDCRKIDYFVDYGSYFGWYSKSTDFSKFMRHFITPETKKDTN